MRILVLAVFLLGPAIFAFGNNAQAANDADTYAGVHVGTLTIEEADLDYVQLRLGIETHENIDLEFRHAQGFNDEDLDGITTELENLTGVYMIGHTHLTPNVKVYAMVGWATGTVKASFMGQTAQIEEDGPSYGIGFEIGGFNADWTQYTVDSLDAVNALSVGYNYHFD